MKKLLSLIMFTTLLISCTAEQDFTSNTGRTLKKQKTNISFDDFKRETNLKDFKKTLQLHSNQFQARNADGSYELSDFDIDTEMIKRLELDDKTTYSFRIYPTVVISPSIFYNLTMDLKDGVWIQNVLELKPTIENFENLISGSTNDINGEVSILFTSNNDGLITTNNCYTVGIISNNCDDQEISETCVNKKYSTFCYDNENNIIIGNSSNIINESNNIDKDYSFILNINDLKKNIRVFTEEHVLLNNQILNLLENETDYSFDNFPYSELSSTPNEQDFKLALANSGIIKHEDLGNFLLRKSQNWIDFVANNKDFALLKPETKQTLINDAIDAAIVENPLILNPAEPDNTTLRTCAQQYKVDKDRCNRNSNTNGWFALAAFVGGPVTGGLACVAVIAESANCLDDAMADYKECLKP